MPTCIYHFAISLDLYISVSLSPPRFIIFLSPYTIHSFSLSLHLDLSFFYLPMSFSLSLSVLLSLPQIPAPYIHLSPRDLSINHQLPPATFTRSPYCLHLSLSQPFNSRVKQKFNQTKTSLTTLSVSPPLLASIRTRCMFFLCTLPLC